ncbi:hypothetical protein HDU86_002255 [Geranomyces michiganensis]|nr:hypothetical protein HDU86_002255 [Geranomyces michiganensis]
MASLSVRFRSLEGAQEELAHVAQRTQGSLHISTPTTSRIVTGHKEDLYVQRRAITENEITKRKRKRSHNGNEFLQTGQIHSRFAPYLRMTLSKGISAEQRHVYKGLDESTAEWKQKLDLEIDTYMKDGREARARVKEDFKALQKFCSGTGGNESPCPELIEM